jgi:hypothetical protein
LVKIWSCRGRRRTLEKLGGLDVIKSTLHGRNSEGKLEGDKWHRRGSLSANRRATSGAVHAGHRRERLDQIKARAGSTPCRLGKQTWVGTDKEG